jgi:GT2 family glycosyltransferase
MIRRSAFLESGGFFEPYFLTVSEIDLTTRLLAKGYDVRYLPAAEFDHMKAVGGLRGAGRTLRLRIRNQIWYFWLRFPLPLALIRIPAYLAFDAVECAFRRAPGAWLGGIADAWRDRGRIRGMRDPIPRELVPRAELNRGRMHLRLLAAQIGRKLGRRRER